MQNKFISKGKGLENVGFHITAEIYSYYEQIAFFQRQLKVKGLVNKLKKIKSQI